MSFDLNFSPTKSITAKACEPLPGYGILGKVTWINLSINTTDGQSFTLTCFFHGEDKIGLAKAYADTINAVKEPT